MPRRGFATAERWAEALDGGPYVVAGPAPAERDRGIGFSGFADSPEGMSIRFVVGRGGRRVGVDSKRRNAHHRLGETHLAAQLVFGLHGISRGRKLPLPMVLDRAKLRMNVDGRLRVFTGIAAGDAFSVEATIGSVVVTVTCPDGHPGDGFGLSKLSDKALAEFVRSERQRWRGA